MSIIEIIIIAGMIWLGLFGEMFQRDDGPPVFKLEQLPENVQRLLRKG